MMYTAALDAAATAAAATGEAAAATGAAATGEAATGEAAAAAKGAAAAMEAAASIPATLCEKRGFDTDFAISVVKAEGEDAAWPGACKESTPCAAADNPFAAATLNLYTNTPAAKTTTTAAAPDAIPLVKRGDKT